MAAKKTARKARKTVTRAKASRKSTSRSARKSPKYNTTSGQGLNLPGNPIEVF